MKVNGLSFPDISISEALYARAGGLIPARTQTLAKGPTQYVGGVAPRFLKRGKGSRVWDVDGNEYIDFNAAVGPLSLGYCYDAVDEAIRRQLNDGITFSLVHPLELEAAELLAQVIPNAEAIRYAKSGAEATSAAVRLARAYTKRDRVLCCGYHGWHDWYIGATPRSAGVPRDVQALVQSFPYNDLEAVKRLVDEETACVILEPMLFDWPMDDFLSRLLTLCRQCGALLIFDEMWTGFRFALGGAQEYFRVEADLACFSKAVANGMPVAVLAGRREVMRLLEEEVFFFSTFGGEALSLAALVATVNEIRARNVPAYLAEQGLKLLEGYNRIAEKLGIDGYTGCKGHPARTLVTFEPTAGDPLLMKSLVQQELIRRGFLWSGFHNLSFSHTDEEVDALLQAYWEVLPILKKAVEDNVLSQSLQGEPVQPVFRKT